MFHNAMKTNIPEINNYWDYTIEPNENILQLKHKELWEYRDLLYLLVKRDIIAFYKHTIFGPLWFFIQPLFQTLVFAILFGKIAALSVDGLPHVLFYLLGIVIWTYFADTLTKTSTVFKDNTALMGKVYFPRLILPISIAISGLVKFAVQFFLFLFFYFYYIHLHVIHSNGLVFIFPFILGLLLMQSLGWGLLISSLTNKYRDLAFVVSFGIQLLMYITPVVYPLSMAPASIKKFLLLNPLNSLFEVCRLGFLGKGYYSWHLFLYTSFFSLFILIVGIICFNKVEKKFIDTI